MGGAGYCTKTGDRVVYVYLTLPLSYNQDTGKKGAYPIEEISDGWLSMLYTRRTRLAISLLRGYRNCADFADWTQTTEGKSWCLFEYSKYKNGAGLPSSWLCPDEDVNYQIF